MQIQGHDIGVCSWSLRPANMAQLLAGINSLELVHAQLALRPLLTLDEGARQREIELLRKSPVQLTAGMIHFDGEDYSTIDAIRRTGGFVPDDAWAVRKSESIAAARLGRELGLRFISAHAGFIPLRGEKGHDVMCRRVGELADEFAACGIDLLLETGQEPAAELLEFLQSLGKKNVGVNFDPANMILYGAGNPLQAIGILARYIRHVHVKDAAASNQPGKTWGAEVPFGTGEVSPPAFLKALHKAGYAGPLVIEREAGEDRMGDVALAIESLELAAAQAI